MKKTLTLAALVLLLAAGCNSNKVVKNNQNQSDQQNQDQQSTSTTDNLPQGEKSGWNSYTSPTKYGFSIQYPNDFGFNTDVNKIKSLSYIPTCDENTVGCVFYSGDKYKGTNFEGAGVSVNILSDLNTEAKCYNFGVATNEAQNPVTDVNINGVTFKSATGGQGAAGHFVKTQVYRNFHNNTCYEVAQRVSNSNINNYPAGTIKEFNQNEIWNNLKQIVSTFKFTDPSATDAVKPGTQVTVIGTTVCLPHKGAKPGQSQTLECAIGLKEIGTGKNYSLKDVPNPTYDTNVTVRVTGTLIDDSTSIYDIAGAIEVKSMGKVNK